MDDKIRPAGRVPGKRIRLEDSALLEAFAQLPPLPDEVLEVLFRDLDIGPDAALREADLRVWVPFMRGAWLWLTAHRRPTLAITATFLSLRRRCLAGPETPDRPPCPEESKKGQAVWQELGSNLLRCSPEAFLRVVDQVGEACPRFSAHQRRFIRALLEVESLRDLRQDLRARLAGTPDESDDVQVAQLGAFLADWLRSVRFSRPEDIIQKLVQLQRPVLHGGLVPGKPMSRGVLEKLRTGAGKDLLLRSAHHHPGLFLVTRGQGGLEYVEKGLPVSQVQTALARLPWEIYPAEKRWPFAQQAELALSTAAPR